MRRMTTREKIFSIKALQGLINFIVKAFPMFLLAKILKNQKKYKNVWLFAERSSEARDNGYHLFKYIREKHSNIGCYYVIEENSKDVSRVEPYGNVISFYSYKHYLYYYLAEKHITTHGSGYGMMPDTFACRLLERFFKNKVKKIYLKHGILFNHIQGLVKERSGIDLFVCGAKPEYEFVRKSFGYSKKEVKYLGLARFDSLINSESNKGQIMIMFTWRRWLNRLNDDQFRKSRYFTELDSFLQSDKFNNLINNHNLKVKFCLHPRLQKFRDLFSADNPNITIVNTQNTDIQELLKSSSLLITDYSSVFFDFAYMQKPIIYYHFDFERFKKEQYNEGYFKYSKHGFGPLVKTQDKLIERLEKFIESNYLIDDKYNQRINYFFPLIDNKNCERNFQQILNM